MEGNHKSKLRLVLVRLFIIATLVSGQCHDVRLGESRVVSTTKFVLTGRTWSNNRIFSLGAITVTGEECMIRGQVGHMFALSLDNAVAGYADIIKLHDIIINATTGPDASVWYKVNNQNAGGYGPLQLQRNGLDFLLIDQFFNINPGQPDTMVCMPATQNVITLSDRLACDLVEAADCYGNEYVGLAAVDGGDCGCMDAGERFTCPGGQVGILSVLREITCEVELRVTEQGPNSLSWDRLIRNQCLLH